MKCKDAYNCKHGEGIECLLPIAGEGCFSQRVEWRNITTAPVNREVLVTRDYNNATIALAQWDGKAWSTGPSPMDYYSSPTHWQDLPENVTQREI